jgi:putative ABC transport system substrate-binding protein
MTVRSMKRREFITLLGGATAAWPLAARAQQADKRATVGYLGSSTPLAESQRVASLLQRLRELGWAEGRNLAIEYRWADGRTERFAEIAAEFVRLRVDVIVTAGTPPVKAAMQATSVIPIVFPVGGDPVGTGLVASLARPGGNVTGLSTLAADLAGKRLELLREVVPRLHRLAIIGNVSNPIVPLEIEQVRTSAPTFGLDVIAFEIRRTEDIAPAFEAFKDRADALYVCAEPLVNANRIRISTLSLTARLPTMHGSPESVEAGGLISYSPNFLDLYRRTGDYVDKILRGAKPADIPVEQPTKFDLVINLTTAKALGLTIAESFVLRADQVIE